MTTVKKVRGTAAVAGPKTSISVDANTACQKALKFILRWAADGVAKVEMRAGEEVVNMPSWRPIMVVIESDMALNPRKTTGAQCRTHVPMPPLREPESTERPDSEEAFIVLKQEDVDTFSHSSPQSSGVQPRYADPPLLPPEHRGPDREIAP